MNSSHEPFYGGESCCYHHHHRLSSARELPYQNNKFFGLFGIKYCWVDEKTGHVKSLFPKLKILFWATDSVSGGHVENVDQTRFYYFMINCLLFDHVKMFINVTSPTNDDGGLSCKNELISNLRPPKLVTGYLDKLHITWSGTISTIRLLLFHIIRR